MTEHTYESAAKRAEHYSGKAQHDAERGDWQRVQGAALLAIEARLEALSLKQS